MPTIIIQKLSSRIPSFIIDISAIFSGKVINIVLAGISGIIIARLLGPEKKGIITTIIIIPTIVLSLSDLGFRQATIHFLGKKIYSDQIILNSLSFAFLITSLLSICLSSIFYYIGGYFLKYGWELILLSLVIIPNKIIVTYLSGIFLAKRKIQFVAIVYSIIDLIYFINAILLFIFSISDIKIVLLSQLVSQIIPSIIIIVKSKPYGKICPEFNREIFQVMLNKGIMYAIALFIINLNFNFSILLLETFSNVKEVGIYSVGITIANLLWLFPNAINMAIFSHSATTDNEVNFSRKVARLVRCTIWLAIFPISLLYLFSSWLIPLLYTNQYIESISVVRIMLPGAWMMLIFLILNGDLAGRGRPDASFWVLIVSLIINIVLNYFLDPIMGANGCAIAQTISYSIASILYVIIYSKMSGIKISEIVFFQKNDYFWIKNNIKTIINKVSKSQRKYIEE